MPRELPEFPELQLNPIPHSGNSRHSGGYPIAPESLPKDPVGLGGYALRFARTEADLDAILKLRSDVFNLELDEAWWSQSSPVGTRTNWTGTSIT
jgi:hypothetical protein